MPPALQAPPAAAEQQPPPLHEPAAHPAPHPEAGGKRRYRRLLDGEAGGAFAAVAPDSRAAMYGALGSCGVGCGGQVSPDSVPRPLSIPALFQKAEGERGASSCTHPRCRGDPRHLAAPCVVSLTHPTLGLKMLVESHHVKVQAKVYLPLRALCRHGSTLVLVSAGNLKVASNEVDHRNGCSLSS